MIPTPEMLSSVPFQYAQAVLDKTIVTGKWVYYAAQRFFDMITQAEDQGFWLDHEAGMRAIDFFPMFLQHTKGPLAKEKRPFLLSPYQQFSIYNIVGWKVHGSQLRRFRKVYEKEARKNGKSAKVAGAGLLFEGFDGEEGGEVYVGATKEAQAKIIWEQGGQFVYKSLPLRYLGFQVTQREIRFSRLQAVFRYLGGDSKTQDGLNPSVAFIDEYHAFKDDGVVEVLESAMGARDNPLLWIITTAGFNIMSGCKLFEDMCKEVLDPENPKTDDRLFIMIHDLDDDDDWEDEKNWIKANPNLDYNPPLLDYIRGEYQMAKNHPRKVPNFKTKHLNIWVDAPQIWIPTEIWRRNKHGLSDNEVLAKFQQFGGYAALDLSTTTDLTAYVMISEPDELGDRYLVWYVFCPEDTIDRRSKEDRVPYRFWRDAGQLIATPGEVVDYNEVEKVVKATFFEYNIARVEIDRYKASNITTNLMDAGINVSWFSQTITNYDTPTKEFERLLTLNKIKHNGNPIGEWSLSGCVTIEDSNENIRIHKGKSHAGGKRIDPIIGSIMALGGSLSPPEENNESKYNNPDEEIFI